MRKRFVTAGAVDLVADGLLLLLDLRRWKVCAGIGAYWQRVAADNHNRLSGGQANTPRCVANLDRIQLGGDAQRTVRVVRGIEARATDANGGGGSGNPVVVAVAFANQAGDCPHASAQQIDKKSILQGVGLVHIVTDLEFGVGLQRHQPTIGKPDLRATVLARHDCLAAFNALPLDQRLGTAIGQANIDVPDGDLCGARRCGRSNRHRVCG